MEHTLNGTSTVVQAIPKQIRRKVMDDNMHLMKGMEFENGMPKIKAYNGPTDFELVPYTKRNSASGKGEILHFFLDDYRFRDAVWYNLEYTTYSINKFDYYFTPDLSLWRNIKTEYYNRKNLYRTRFVGAYWQLCGYLVIPTASWGGLGSFTYCFDGLPSESVIAVSGMGNRKTTLSFNRWCNGLRRLEASKHPTLILVYGDEVEVPGLHTPIQFKQSFISERLRNEQTK